MLSIAAIAFSATAQGDDMTETPREFPSGLTFVGRLALAFAWIGLAGYASWVLLNDTPQLNDILAAVFLCVAPVAWCLLKLLELIRSDELHQKVVARGAAQGLLFAVLWPSLLVGGGVLSSIVLGNGEVNLSGMMQNAVTYVAIMPAIAALVSETVTFALLRSYARRGE
jgi:hypothetical protein